MALAVAAACAIAYIVVGQRLYGQVDSGLRAEAAAAAPTVGPGGSKAITGYWPNWVAIPEGSHHVNEMFAYLDYMSVDGVQKWFAVTTTTTVTRTG